MAAAGSPGTGGGTESDGTESGSAGSRSAGSRSAEEQMLRDALGDDLVGELRVLSREPFGSGALTGFEEAPRTQQDAPVRYWYVDTSRKQVESETGFVLGDPERPEARIWLHPADPRLPALAPASFPDAAATLMGRLGISIDRRPELLVYRPGKRAMFRMRAGERETYLKIVRPDASASIVQLQESLRAGGVPVPLITGWSELGIVLTETAAGVALTSRLHEFDPERLLDSIESLREHMGGVDTGRDARASLADRSDWYLTRSAAAVDRALELEGAVIADRSRDAGGDARPGRRAPSGIAALTGPLRAVTDMIESTDASALVVDPDVRRTVHGDLHVGQLFVAEDDASVISGVIDIDTCGLGDPADDEAAFIGHLVASLVLARADEERSAGFRRLLDAAVGRWLAADRPGRVRVAHRTAVHVLAHALAPIERGDLEMATAELAIAVELLEGVHCD
ncbi:Phosphotransferase enzyme family protein [Agrococcus baldri]|uniref:Phosphotransferase enzyme family protein n=2 Tax=Agrococcus baldri TaxID=153730 RepID=A0AA94HNL9_9MICO|nr:Phosphotransferase enzyme family protein [Agrococcus baldri]